VNPLLSKRLTATVILLGQMICMANAYAHEIRPGLLQVTETSESSYSVIWKQPLLGERRLPLEPVLEPDCGKLDARIQATNSALIERWETQCSLERIRIDGLNRTLTDVMLEYTDIISSTRSLLITITCFTLAHSVTLALSVLGWVQLSQAAVEACIALSIVLLAREVLTHGRSLLKERPWLAAFAFGLLHGFGFAGALRDIGLPDENLWLALLSFNVGIELGQLLLVAVWVLLAWLTRRFTQREKLRPVLAYAIGGMAMFWTLERVLPLLGSALDSALV